MSRYSVIRLLETFFRRWWLYLVPLLLLCGLGAATLATKKNVYKSVATIEIQGGSGILEKLGGTTSDFGYDTPAAATAKQINSRLQTQLFVEDIANRARIGELVKSGVITYDKLRESISAVDAGTNLLKVFVYFEDPTVTQLLAQSTIEAFVQSVINANIEDYEVAVKFLDEQLATYEADVAASRDALNLYLLDHPAPGFGAERSDEESLEIGRLQSDVSAAEERYNAVISKREDARLSTEQTKATVSRRITVVDPPELPVVPENGLRSAVTGFAVFAAMGVLLSIGAVVVATTLDHSIRFPSDMKDRLGLGVLAVVPQSKILQSSSRGRSRRSKDVVAEPERERLAPRVSAGRTVNRPAARSGSGAGGYGSAGAGAGGYTAAGRGGGEPARRPAERPVERPAERPAARREPPAPPAPRAPRPAAERPMVERPAERPAPPPAAAPVAPRPAPPAERPAVAGGPVRREQDALPSPSASQVAADQDDTGRAWPPGRRPGRGNNPDPEQNGSGSGWPPSRRGGRPGNIPHAS